MRRILALLALAAAAWLAYAGTRLYDGTILSLIAYIGALVLGIGGTAVLLFNLPVLGKTYEDSGFGLLPERRKHLPAVLLIWVMGAALAFISARGLYKGSIPAIGSGPDLVFAQNPTGYVMTFAAFLAGAAALVWLGWKMLRNPPPDTSGGGVR